jgi:hypothetical protein
MIVANGCDGARSHGNEDDILCKYRDRREVTVKLTEGAE